MKFMYKIYKIYVIINSKTSEYVYVGQTTKTLEKRFKQHKTNIMSLEKYLYLKENECEIRLLEEVKTQNEANVREQYYISLYITYTRLNQRLQIDDKNHIIHKIKKEEILKENEKKAKDIIKKMSKK